jgi:5-methylthioadenosine/S-adenosylhomocysteine deaminase
MPDSYAIVPRWIIPVEPANLVLEAHAVIVANGLIDSIVPVAALDDDHPGIERIELPGHALIPGLVNAHTHAAMSLMRGLADDLPLMPWLKEHIWPAEARHVSPEFVRDGTLLACAEMLRAGTTCFNDMYFFPDAAAGAVSDAGMRAALGIIVIEFPSAYASAPDEYLEKGLSLRDLHRDDPLLTFCLAPHAPYTVSDTTFRKVGRLAAELDIPVHMHLHETEGELERSIAEHGVRPLERLHALGLLGPQLISVHSVHLAGSEIDLLGRHGCSVAHCPSSNLKLASGFSPAAALSAAGVNLSLGTDGAASNNRLDMLQEMRQAALLAKAVARDASALPAAAALRAATLGGAQALGIGHRTGSIVPGKEADLVAVRMDDPELKPVFDPVSHIVYVAGREHVDHVWVHGEMLLNRRILARPAFADLDEKVALWQNRLQ